MTAETGATTVARREAEALLRTCAPFVGLGPDTLAAISALARWQDWASGESVFHRGDEGNTLILLKHGRLRLSLSSAAGREILLGTVGPGGIVGEVALIDGHPRSADATAMEPTRGLVLRRDAFLGVMQRDPALGLGMARYLCTLLRSTNFQMESIALHDLRARLVRFILFSLRQTHGPDLPPRADLVIGLTQGELSSLLGASRPKLNRAIQDLLEEGAMRRRDDRLDCDVARLRQIADEAGATDD